jgi:hypothetical protein
MKYAASDKLENRRDVLTKRRKVCIPKAVDVKLASHRRERLGEGFSLGRFSSRRHVWPLNILRSND